MKMLTAVDIIGYTTMSGSNPRLKETKATLIVTKEKSRPIANVATITDTIAEKSARVMPQSK
jgi:hypothetical protein